MDAQQWLDNVTTEHVTGTYVDPSRKSEMFVGVAELWFATKSTKQPKTIAGYRSCSIGWFCRGGADVALKDIGHEDVQAWVTGLSKSGYRFTDRGLSASRVFQAYQVVDRFLRYAIRTKRLAINPANDVELPRKTEPEKRYLSHEQVADLAGEGERSRVLVLVLVYCGLRFGEAVALRVKNVDIERKRLQVRSSATAVAGQGSSRAIQRTLTLDRYGHLFPDDLDSVASALGAAYRLHTDGVVSFSTIASIAR
ncbi:MAG: hypothetical protein GX610_13000 [Rhodococcus sp.]|nr:hypothetical protein [Rhodococcus sp. (in: high G+C Gram-positive bacteria)]